jgi:hypothetical protein
MDVRGLLNKTLNYHVQGYKPASEQLGLLSAALPSPFGDVAGLLGDVAGYAANPSSLTPARGLLSLAGVIPGVPSQMDDAEPFVLKLGSKMKEIRLNTKPLSEALDEVAHRNPNNPSQYVLGDAVVEIGKFGDDVILKDIRALQPGGGRAAMERITKMADESGETISLHAVPYGPNAWGKEKLVDWYREFGFEPVRGDLMRRTPK